MTDQHFDSLVHLKLVYPDSFLSSHHVAVLFVGMEELSESARTILLYLSGQLSKIASWRSRPQVKLVDVDDSKLVVFDQLETRLELLFSFYLTKELPYANPHMMSVAIVTSGTCSRK